MIKKNNITVCRWDVPWGGFRISYSVAAGYNWLVSNHPSHLQSCNTDISFSWKDFWKRKTNFRILVLVWKVLNDAIPTKV